MLIVSSIVLAYFTYIFIEKKFKKITYQSSVILFVSNVALLLLGITSYELNLKPRNSQSGIESIVNATNEGVSKRDLMPIKFESQVFYTKMAGNEKVVMYGDSHMEQYIPRVVKLLDDHQQGSKTAVFVTKPGCPPMPDVYSQVALDFGECVKFREESLNYILSDDIQSVVVTACWNCYFIEGLDYKDLYYLNADNKVYFNEVGGADLGLKSLENFLLHLSAHKKVYLLLDNPAGESFNPKNYWSGSRINEIQVKFPTTKIKLDDKQNQLRYKLLEIAHRTNVIAIDPIAELCKNDECLFLLENNVPIYKDNNHLRPSYIKTAIDYLDVAIISDSIPAK
ncbi:SGNH hydrolase domain-containing protein [Methylomonas sp. AM2-LC]|uniref:SGNH hydrolase domain-containing protein n=1 Tax=Methylomonas sp. AM2-LC TaxID=3153301 RepID=UPI003266F5B9